jgi:hypothetical protein
MPIARQLLIKCHVNAAMLMYATGGEMLEVVFYVGSAMRLYSGL